jgi:phosphotransferase system HPr-like phosphotransfer protein
VTGLAHFYERHENDIRSQGAKTRIADLVDRSEVQDAILNHLLHWAKHFMEAGRTVAEDLIREFTNVQELEVDLDDDLVLHARPAALIVGIANYYGTPVEMEVAGQRCNAASILELLVTIGSHPDERRFLFRGDENPLRDIGLLFQYGLGENGINGLPEQLAYLRSTS